MDSHGQKRFIRGSGRNDPADPGQIVPDQSVQGVLVCIPGLEAKHGLGKGQGEFKAVLQGRKAVVGGQAADIPGDPNSAFFVGFIAEPVNHYHVFGTGRVFEPGSPEKPAAGEGQAVISLVSKDHHVRIASGPHVQGIAEQPYPAARDPKAF